MKVMAGAKQLPSPSLTGVLQEALLEGSLGAVGMEGAERSPTPSRAVLLKPQAILRSLKASPCTAPS